jgi:exodeoxyribonuclease V alpha subunit
MKSALGSTMELPEALETYLLETGQIYPLARRQARMLSRAVADERLQKEARILLLLNLAALGRGAPRAPETFLLKPLDKDVAEQYIAAYTMEHPGSNPAWKKIITDPATLTEARKILDDSIHTPQRLAPLTGEEPQEGDGRYPLIITNKLKGGRTGFSRYWSAASSLEKAVSARLQQQSLSLREDSAAEALAYVFGTHSTLEGNQRFHYRQVAAAALALRTRFLIVSGGPGTGKTRVVTQVLRTLIHAFTEIQTDRIVLCAPTGRAKARLGESIDQGIEFLETHPLGNDAEGWLRDLSLKNLQRKTIHSLLGTRPDGSTKYHSANPLSCQVIVVDEASMVDLHLFAALMDAAAPACRIILVGDMHQLPSVEAGAVLGDLTDRFAGLDGFPTLTKETADWTRTILKNIPVDEAGGSSAPSLVLSTTEMMHKAGHLADHAIILAKSYRSTKEILDISAHVNRGDATDALRSIAGNNDTSVVILDSGTGLDPVKTWLSTWYSNRNLGPLKALKDLDTDAVDDPGHHDHGTACSGLDKAFEVFDASRILTLAHEGRRGRIAINLLADKLLRPQLDRGSGKRFFHGQQVILGQTLYDLDLYNGDMGMVVQSKSAGQKVVFRCGKKYTIHALERLTGIEPAFAMTVHKAQGSEFDTVLLVLPEYKSPLLTRQILYTGLTRAKKRIRILGTNEMLQKAIETRDERPGGVEL